MLSIRSRRWLHMGVVLVIGLLFLTVTLAWARTGTAAVGEPGNVPNRLAFQGSVLSGGQPFSGTGHFKFALVGAGGSPAYWSNDGTGVGPSPAMPSSSVVLTVTDGLFNVLLGDTSQPGMSMPLSPDLFTTSSRWLRVWFDDGVNGFQQLSPDAPLTSVPFAFNAATLNGLDSSAFVQPADVPNLADSAGFLKRSLADTLYVPQVSNILLVAPSGGDFTSIQAALNSITQATALNPYLIEVAPGIYSETIVMKPYVDIQGSGEGVTKITAHGSAVISDSTVTGASNAEIRWLTIENTGGSTNATAVYNDAASPRLTHVTVSTSNDSFAHGVLNEDAAPILTNVTLSATGNYAYGLVNHRSLPLIQDSTISVTGATNAFGVYGYVDLDGVPYTVTIQNSSIASSGHTLYGQLAYTTRVAFSRLAGGPAFGGGAMICAGVVDENDVFYASTCP